MEYKEQHDSAFDSHPSNPYHDDYLDREAVKEALQNQEYEPDADMEAKLDEAVDKINEALKYFENTKPLNFFEEIGKIINIKN
jgi:hypothetical protein